MSESGDTLHLDGVHLLQRVVKDTRGVYHLPSQVLVVHVTDEERLCGKGVRLYVYVCPGHLVDERGLAYVGVSTDEMGAWKQAALASRGLGDRASKMYSSGLALRFGEDNVEEV